MMRRSWSSRQSLIGIIGAGVGLILGILAGLQPLLLCLAIATIIIVIVFFAYFEQTVLGLLIIRSSLDLFSDQGIPAAFAICLDLLIFLYIIASILTGKKIQTNRFWWFLLIWVLIQSLWVILLPFDVLGLSGSHFLSLGFREWLRLFSCVMVYFIVMQLEGKLPAQKIINLLFLSLILPMTAAFLQLILPPSLLPDFLALVSSNSDIENASRINGTFSHPSPFTTFLVLFIGLTCWKLEHSKIRWPWLVLIGLLIFLITSTKALIGLPMTAVVILVFNLPRFTPLRFGGACLLCLTIVAFFASSEFGQDRLASLYETPLLNPDISIYDAILTRRYNNNSFNWRIEQWTYLLKIWPDYPILGYGLSTIRNLTHLGNEAHNDYIRALVEGGIVGFTAFITFLGVNLSRLILMYRSLPKGSAQGNFCLLLTGMLVAIMVGMLSDNIFSHTTLFFYWLSLSSVAGWKWDDSRSY